MFTHAVSSTTPTNANGTASNVNADGTVTAQTGQTTQNQFLQLLVNELQNQDPTQPTDETQTLSQLAQFSQLQATQNLSDTLTASAGFSNVSQSASLIGKTVTTATATDAGITGVVTSVSLSGGTTYLEVGGQNVDASTITGITATPSTTGSSAETANARRH
jgi:flagellar basal-body rod modification protein FlgD